VELLDGLELGDDLQWVGQDLGASCQHIAAATAAGATRVGEFFSCAGEKGDRCDFPVQLEAGRCDWLLGCGDPQSVKSLYLYLWDSTEKRVTEDKPDSPNPVIGHCPTAAGLFKFQVKVSSGGGAAKVGLYTK
jgi:hypothetical protein